jgi:predicted metal-dependent phosphoesterase TrpH
MTGFYFDTHVHTSFSRDAWQTPEEVILTASRVGLSAVAITDHNTFAGVIHARDACAGTNIILIPGEEVSTEYGDLIGLFLNEEIQSRTFGEALDEIHLQGGLSVLPHPLRRKRMPPEDLLVKLDIIEILNGRTSILLNNEAERLASTLKKPGIAGTDAHFSWELGRIRNISSEPFGNNHDVRRVLDNGDFTRSGCPENALSRKANMGLSYVLKRVHGR